MAARYVSAQLVISKRVGLDNEAAAAFRALLEI
jgi:hypothetical protein